MTENCPLWDHTLTHVCLIQKDDPYLATPLDLSLPFTNPILIQSSPQAKKGNRETLKLGQSSELPLEPLRSLWLLPE